MSPSPATSLLQQLRKNHPLLPLLGGEDRDREIRRRGGACPGAADAEAEADLPARLLLLNRRPILFPVEIWRPSLLLHRPSSCVPKHTRGRRAVARAAGKMRARLGVACGEEDVRSPGYGPRRRRGFLARASVRGPRQRGRPWCGSVLTDLDLEVSSTRGQRRRLPFLLLLHSSCFPLPARAAVVRARHRVARRPPPCWRFGSCVGRTLICLPSLLRCKMRSLIACSDGGRFFTVHYAFWV